MLYILQCSSSIVIYKKDLKKFFFMKRKYRGNDIHRIGTVNEDRLGTARIIFAELACAVAWIPTAACFGLQGLQDRHL